MPITYRTALELASHEGLVRQAYKDSVGVWTWGIGITNASGHNVNRYIANPQPLEHCLAVYVWALEKYAKPVREAFANVPLNETQFAAALSFHYNTGAIATASWVKSFKAGKVSQAREEFMQWRKPSEIIERRTKERDLFFNGVWSSNGTVTEYTKVTAAGNIVWSSAVRTDIREALTAAMAPTDAHAAQLPEPTTEVEYDPSVSEIIAAIEVLLGNLRNKLGMT